MYNCINLIKISVSKNKKGFVIINNTKNINIVKVFLKINIIKFVRIKDNYIFAYINYVNNKPIFKNIINMFKPSKKRFISLKELEKIKKKHNWILILSTNKGLINNFEAVNFKVGGLLIAKI